MNIDGVEVAVEGLELTEEEIKLYIDYVTAQKGKPTKLKIKEKGNGEIALLWERQREKFERIRRITVYLVGTIDLGTTPKRQKNKTV